LKISPKFRKKFKSLRIFWLNLTTLLKRIINGFWFAGLQLYQNFGTITAKSYVNSKKLKQT